MLRAQQSTYRDTRACAGGNGISYTEYEVAMGTLLKKDLDQYDFFILVTRDPLARSVSSFNFDHLIGGGSNDVNSIVQDTLVPSLPPGCTDECDFCLPQSSALVDPASSFNERPGYGTMPPYLVPNMTEAPLATPCTYDTFAGAVPTGPKPLMASMYVDCFPQLPGGVSAWAEALDGEGACADLARRHLHETAESEHMNNGFDHMVPPRPSNGRSRACRRPLALLLLRTPRDFPALTL